MKYLVKIKMETIIPQWNILEDVGLGRRIGTIKTDFEDYLLYEKRVRLVQSIKHPNNYGTVLSKDIYSVKNGEFFENKDEKLKIIYFGGDKFKAIDSFKKIIEKNKKIKENLLYQIVSRN